MSYTKRVARKCLLFGGVVAALGMVVGGTSAPAAADGGPPLGAARSFVVLGGSTVANSGPSSFRGDVGVSPGTSITGFPPGTVTDGAIHAGDAAAAQAHSDAALAYAFLEGMASLPANNLTGTDLGGLTLAPGVYKFNTSAQLTGGLTLDAQGDSGALFVVQIGSTLTTASNATVVVINGGADYDESNIFWQVGSSATLGTGTAFTGNILAFSSITVVSGSSMTGNALALNGAVTTDSNTNSSPALAGSGPVPPGPVVPGPEAPIDLTAFPIAGAACTGADLAWTDTSDDETEFRVYRRDGAGPDFVQVGTVPTTDGIGTGGRQTFQDPVLNPSTTFTYYVTQFGPADGESAPSNEALVDTCTIAPPTLPPARWLDVHLGRRRNVIQDRVRSGTDRIVIRGSFQVIDVDGSVPTVLHDADPRAGGITIQVRAPGNLILVTIPANDAGWKASRRGRFQWRSRDGADAPVSRIRINTRKSQFSLISRRNEFGSVPVNSITVALAYQSALGSETRAWSQQETMPTGTGTMLKLPR